MTKAEQQQRRQEWEKRIAEYQASGQSVREWCAANGVKPNRLWYWLRRTRKSLETKSTTWVPVELSSVFPGERASNGLVVKVGKANIEVRPGFDPELLSIVVRVLSGIC